MPPDTTATTGAGEGDAMDWEAAQPAADPPHPFDVLQLDEHIRAASAGAWDVPDLRPLQRDAIRLVVRPDRPNQVLLVAVTSAGKTHVLRVVGHILGGIGIIFIPLLTLSADVMAKFTSGDERWGSIEVQHLDELWLNDKRKYRDVLERLGNVERTTLSTAAGWRGSCGGRGGWRFDNCWPKIEEVPAWAGGEKETPRPFREGDPGGRLLLLPRQGMHACTRWEIPACRSVGRPGGPCRPTSMQ